MFNEIKWFIQRGKRGYSDADLWNFDSYLCEFMPAALRSLKKDVGCPTQFYDETALNKENHKWIEAIEAMAQGFEAANFIKQKKFNKWVSAKDKNGKSMGSTLETDFESLNAAKKKMELGLGLFSENFLNLWN